MKYLEISVGKSINPLTGESWIKTDAKVSVGEDENPELVFQKVKSDIESWLGNSYSNNEMKGTIIKPVEEEVHMDKRIATIIEDINQCTEIDAKNALGVQIGLIGYEEISNSNPEIKAAFELKMAQLTHKI